MDTLDPTSTQAPTEHSPGAPTTPIPDSGIRYEALLDCVHCGLCLTACPTFNLLGTEADSPRGRLYLIRTLAEGRSELNPAMVGHLDLCLSCRACETACPSAVPYGELLGQVRGKIEKEYPRPLRERLGRRLLVETLTHPWLLAPAMAAARLVGRLTGDKSGGVPPFMTRLLTGKEATVPMPLPPAVALRPASLPYRTPAVGEQRARVGLLTGCVMSALYGDINAATARVLATNGCEVIVPRGQGCCGAMHLHQGYRERAAELARRTIDAFLKEPLDAVIVNSAGCGAMMKEYEELLGSDPDYAPRLPAFRERVRDIAEFLIELGPVRPLNPLPVRITYHDACHLAHAQGIRAQPRALLRQIPGVQLVELNESDWCCGSAGIYNLLQPGVAQQLLERKIANIQATGAEWVVTGNPGCQTWILAGVRDSGRGIQVKHTVEVLDAAYGRPSEAADQGCLSG
jgi:glycolate oxidase iron-sulfur subunit